MTVGTLLAATVAASAIADSVATESRIKGWGGQCLDLPFGNLDNGTDLWMYACNGTNNQSWSSKDRLLKLRSHCMDGEGPTREIGAPAQIWDCADVANQRWKMTVAGEIISEYSGQCLDVYAWDTSLGADVVLWPCNGQANQRWVFADAPDRVKSCDGRYVKSVNWDFTDQGLVLRVEPTRTGDLLAWARRESAWNEVTSCTPSRYESWSFDSAEVANVRNQFDCHAYFSSAGAGIPGGDEWDLESYNKLGRSKIEWANTKCGNE